MKLNESLSYLRNVLTDIETFQKPSLKEDKGHLDHPEDLVFLGGSQGASRAVQALIDTVQNPSKVTIKWDGYPALIFGRGVNGKFAIMDKHMFNKKDGTGRSIYSPQDFVNYDKARGVDRGELSNVIANIWSDLQKASQGTTGYYWGDMIFGSPLNDENGLFKFRANPNGIVYTVEVDSDIGELISGKRAGVAVHQYLDPDAPEKAAEMSTPSRQVAPTDLAVSLDGTIGQLKNNTDVAIVPSKMPITPNLKINNGLVRKANAVIKQYGPAVDQMLDSAPQARNTFNQLFTTYINKKID